MSGEKVSRRNVLTAGVAGVVGLGVGFAGGFILKPAEQTVRTVEVTRTVGGATVTQTLTQSQVDLARKEQTVVIYGVIDIPDFENVMKPAFLRLYPWAKVEYVGLSPSEIVSKSLAEYKAGRVAADVIWNTLGSTLPLVKEGVIEKFDNPMIGLMSYAEGAYDPEKYWNPMSGLPIVLNYNSNLVSRENVPKRYEDLAKPGFKGKIAIDRPSLNNVAGTLFAHLYPILGEEKWRSLMKGIADNQPIFTDSASASFTKVATGEAAVGIGLLHDYLANRGKVPVEIAFAEPVVALPVPLFLPRNAPHPNMGQLFIQWATSVDGLLSLAKTGRTPLHHIVAAYTLPRGLLPEGISLEVAALKNPDYYTNPTKWSDLYRSIFGV
jgi:iron(III) transport system substrate-binding protein